jgi:hypothetical protein
LASGGNGVAVNFGCMGSVACEFSKAVQRKSFRPSLTASTEWNSLASFAQIYPEQWVL